MASFFQQLSLLIKPFRRQMSLVFFIIFLFEFFKLVPTYILARLLDIALVFSQDKIRLILVLLLGLFLISNLVTALEYLLDKKILSSLVNFDVYLLKKCQEKLLNLPLKYHEEHFTGKQVNLIHQGVNRIEELFFNGFYSFVPTLVQVLMSFSVMLFVHFKAALLFSISIPVFFWLTYRMGILLQPIRKIYHDEYDMAAGKFAETIMHIRTVQDFAQEKYEKKIYEDFLGRYQSLRKKRDEIERRYTVYRDIFLNIGRVLMLSYGVYLLSMNQITPGFFVFLITLSEKSYLALFRIGRTYNHVSDSVESVNRIASLLSEKTEPSQIEQHLEAAESRISFEKVSFAYLSDKPVLREVSFTIQPQEIVAIVGRSGAGKSTLVKLLFRHFEINSGKIIFDGQDIRTLTKKSLRRQMAIVSQDIELFHTSIRKNILYGHQASNEEFAAVCQLAHVDEFVKQYPEKYETLVGERGVRLSGGQKQRIAIARALLRKPKLLIFDEATSSLDSESEQLIQKAIFDISKNFTMIIIAHRLSTIQHADKILVFADGKVVESGKYDELVAKDGVFAKMVKVQRESGLRR